MSVLAVCQRQLESELLLVKKEMCLPAENGVSGAAKVPGHVQGLGGHRTRQLVAGRDPLGVFAAPAQVACAADRGAFSESVTLGGAAQIRSEISRVFDLSMHFPWSNQLVKSERSVTFSS